MRDSGQNHYKKLISLGLSSFHITWTSKLCHLTFGTILFTISPKIRIFSHVSAWFYHLPTYCFLNIDIQICRIRTYILFYKFGFHKTALLFEIRMRSDSILINNIYIVIKKLSYSQLIESNQFLSFFIADLVQRDSIWYRLSLS